MKHRPACSRAVQATGTIQMSSASIKRTLSQQLLVGVLLATGLSGGAPAIGLHNGDIAAACACSAPSHLRLLDPPTAEPSSVPAAAAAGFARVFITDGSLMNSFAISTALFLIVIISVITGTALPFGLAMLGFDPANAGTTIQVRLRILGHWSKPHARALSKQSQRRMPVEGACMHACLPAVY